MHAIWALLLDADFVQAYIHGIVIECADGILHRVYPRIFTYSADYPEKWVLLFPHQFPFSQLPNQRVLLATIRSLGLCLCPRCKVPKHQVDQVGTIQDNDHQTKLARNSNQMQYKIRTDIAHQAIYKHGKGVKSKAVEDMLQSESLTPTRVSSISYFTQCFHLILPGPFRIPSHRNWDPLALMYSQCSLLIWCMNLSLASGSPFLSTSFGCSCHLVGK